eukprot:PhF_6_TR30558/c0_g1_i5/m.44874
MKCHVTKTKVGHLTSILRNGVPHPATNYAYGILSFQRFSQFYSTKNYAAAFVDVSLLSHFGMLPMTMKISDAKTQRKVFDVCRRVGATELLNKFTTITTKKKENTTTTILREYAITGRGYPFSCGYSNDLNSTRQLPEIPNNYQQNVTIREWEGDNDDFGLYALRGFQQGDCILMDRPVAWAASSSSGYHTRCIWCCCKLLEKNEKGPPVCHTCSRRPLLESQESALFVSDWSDLHHIHPEGQHIHLLPMLRKLCLRNSNNSDTIVNQKSYCYRVPKRIKHNIVPLVGLYLTLLQTSSNTIDPTVVDFPVFLRALNIIRINSLLIKSSSATSSSYHILSPLTSLLNHSCLDFTCTLELLDDGHVLFRARRDIKEGERLTIHYLGNDIGQEDRTNKKQLKAMKEELWNDFGFRCCCEAHN